MASKWTKNMTFILRFLAHSEGFENINDQKERDNLNGYNCSYP